MPSGNIASSRVVSSRTALLLVAWLISAPTVFAWLMTAGGMWGLACVGIDWTSHLGAVETFYLDGTREIAGSLGDGMLGYPPFAHWLCSVVARICCVPPPRALQLLCAAFGVAGSSFVAWRTTRTATAMFTKTWIRIVTIAFVAACLGALAFLGLGVFGHLAFNFFYAQFCATVIALAGLELLRTRLFENRGLAFLFVHAVGVTLICTHLLPALWFYGAALLMMGEREAILWRAAATVMVNLAIACALLKTNPYARAMTQVASNDGDFVLRTGILTSSSTLIAIVLTSSLLLLVLVISAFRRAGLNGWRWVARYDAGFVSIVALMILNTAIFLISGASSSYSIKKYLMILAFEAPPTLLTVATLMRKNWSRFIGADRETIATTLEGGKASIMLFASLVVITAVQIPWGFWNYDQQPLLYYRQAFLSRRYTVPDTNRAYPLVPRLHSLANFYLATAIVDLPDDARTIAWVDRIIAANPPGEPTLNPASASIPRALYWHTLQVKRRPTQDLTCDIYWPDANEFIRAKSVPATPEEVLVGAQLLDENGGVLEETRGVLRPASLLRNTTFTAVVPDFAQNDRAKQIKVELVQEGVLWFDAKSSGKSSTVFLPVR